MSLIGPVAQAPVVGAIGPAEGQRVDRAMRVDERQLPQHRVRVQCVDIHFATLAGAGRGLPAVVVQLRNGGVGFAIVAEDGQYLGQYMH